MTNGTGTGTLPPITGSRRAVPVPASPSGLPTRRRWGRVAAGAVLALLGAWVAMILVATAGGREETLAMASDVERGQRLERDHLTVVRVAADPGVRTIPAGDLDEVVGLLAGSDLPAGTLPSRDQLLDEGERLVTQDEVVVGARLGAAAAPRGDVPPGTPVLVVVRPGAGDGPSAEATEVLGWLRDIGDPLENTGAREVSLVVPIQSAAIVMSGAADERIAVATLEDGG
ncbi:MAG TPA: SAF domain-containing protein [Acidimicrobiales bacterium]|nr:SAF domain-containing protein [Acidimicrobiales bacterium]